MLVVATSKEYLKCSRRFLKGARPLCSVYYCVVPWHTDCCQEVWLDFLAHQKKYAMTTSGVITVQNGCYFFTSSFNLEFVDILLLKKLHLFQRQHIDSTLIANSVDNFHLHRASGTVYTALDIATGQEVSANIQYWLLLSFIHINQISSDGIYAWKKNGYHWIDIVVFFIGV